MRCCMPLNAERCTADPADHAVGTPRAPTGGGGAGGSGRLAGCGGGLSSEEFVGVDPAGDPSAVQAFAVGVAVGDGWFGWGAGGWGGLAAVVEDPAAFVAVDE